jgi:hypothetical protein
VHAITGSLCDCVPRLNRSNGEFKIGRLQYPTVKCLDVLGQKGQSFQHLARVYEILNAGQLLARNFGRIMRDGSNGQDEHGKTTVQVPGAEPGRAASIYHGTCDVGLEYRHPPEDVVHKTLLKATDGAIAYVWQHLETSIELGVEILTSLDLICVELGTIVPRLRLEIWRAAECEKAGSGRVGFGPGLPEHEANLLRWCRTAVRLSAVKYGRGVPLKCWDAEFRRQGKGWRVL